jgi:hypothetical protein
MRQMREKADPFSSLILTRLNTMIMFLYILITYICFAEALGLDAGSIRHEGKIEPPKQNLSLAAQLYSTSISLLESGEVTTNDAVNFQARLANISRIIDSISTVKKGAAASQRAKTACKIVKRLFRPILVTRNDTQYRTEEELNWPVIFTLNSNST